MNDNKRSHLEMIQGIINRLSQNSFLLKGWSVVLISALMALAAKDSNLIFIFLAYLPALAFWHLDGYFLWQEKLFRELYNYVRRLEEENIDFSMNTKNLEANVESWSKTTLSLTLRIFHGIILLAIIIAMLLLIYKQ